MPRGEPGPGGAEPPALWVASGESIQLSRFSMFHTM